MPISDAFPLLARCTQNEWTIRVLQVQAILDLYLAQMHQIEERDKRLLPSWKSTKSLPKGTQECRHGKCGHYPRVKLDESFEGVKQQASKTPTSGKAKKGKTEAAATAKKVDKASPAKLGNESSYFVVTREQIDKHVIRRGAFTDHFNHPLIIARSGLRHLTSDGDVGVKVIDGDYDGDDECHYPSESESYASDPYDSHRYNDEDFATPRSPRPADSMRSSPSADSLIGRDWDPATRDDILALAVSTLRLIPLVNNLSLTGYLHLCLQRPQPKLNMLRYVSIGPLATPDGSGGYMVGYNLPAMEKLRFCGNMLDLAAAQQIGDREAKGWPALREACWDYGATKMWAREPEE